MFTPALQTRMSTLPWRARIAFAARSTASRSVTSTASTSASPPARSIRRRVSSSASARRPDATTRAPALPSSAAAAWPMPLPPPVTQAIFPARLMLVRRAYDDGSGELVVPALLALVEGDPEEAEAHREHRNQVGEIPADQLAGGRRPERVGIDDLGRQQHLSRRRAAVAPEQDRRDRGQHALEQDVRPQGFALRLQLQVPRAEYRKQDDDDHHADDHGVDEKRAEPQPESGVLGVARQRVGHGPADGSPSPTREATARQKARERPAGLRQLAGASDGSGSTFTQG